MPIQLTYPGVYVQELPSGTHNIAGATTSTTAFVGYLRRGPIDQPVQCQNFGDFQRVFGGLDPQSPVSFQVQQCFLNGGTDVWVSRLVATSAPPVQPATVLNAPAGAPSPGGGAGGGGGGGKTPALPGGAPALTIDSQSPGTWGQTVFVTVDYMTNAQNSFNLTAAFYARSGGNGYSLQQTQSLPGVTLDQTQPNSIFEILQSSANPAAGLIALPVQTTPATTVPFASGTVLTFVPPKQPLVPVSLTVTVVPPPPPGGKATALPPFVGAPVTIAFPSDLIAGLQGALSGAAAALGLPGLARAVVRSCLSPFPPVAPTGGGPPPATPAGPAQLVQIVIPDPAYAGYLIGIGGSPTPPFTTLQTNVQAQQLSVAATTPPNTLPDGAPPTGFDVAGNATNRTGIYALDALGIVNLIGVPDMAGMQTGPYLTAATALLNYAVERRAFALLDIPATIASPSQAVAWITGTPATFGTGIVNGAAYFPQVAVPTPYSTTPMLLGASGTMAGLYAATDVTRGVWKAPAGITAPLAGVQQLNYVMNDAENGLINPLGLNALRTFPIYGNIAWGARTLAAANVADDDWKYVPVRRLALYIEQSLVQGLQWVVFEPNDASLWAQIRLSVNSFLHPLFVQGAFAGQTPVQSYQVICDASTTTTEDMDNGIVNILVLFAPVRPAEFVVISLQQMTGQSTS